MDWKLFLLVLNLLNYVPASYGHDENCRVTVFNYIFTDCNSTYWKGVTFKFGDTKVFKSMEDVCTNGSKAFTVEVEDTCFVKSGELSIYLQDKRSHLKPDFKEWWVEKVMVDCSDACFSRSMTIGIGRKIESGRIYRFENFDTFVNYPQDMLDQRIQDLTNNRKVYQNTKILGIGPLGIRELSREDAFDRKYLDRKKYDLMKQLQAAKKIIFKNVTSANINFNSIREVEEFIDGTVPTFPKPKNLKYWREDKWFAAQRIQGLEPHQISLINDIPSSYKLNVTRAEKVTGEKLGTMLSENRIYITDLKNFEPFPEYIWSPMALFYLTKENTLLPLSIQLEKNNTAEEIFYPDDPTYSWLLAKMYYNVAESVNQQSVSHLAYLHILMERIGTAMFRNLPPSHPVYKLLKPHYYLTYPRNIYGIYTLLGKGGLMDLSLTGKKELNMKLLTNGLISVNYERINPILHDKMRRTENIKNYPYRDRVLDIYKVIRRYVDGIIRNYYSIDDEVADDESLRNFRLMLSLSEEFEGLGMKNVPGCDYTGKMTITDIVDIAASVIFQVTVAHTALTTNIYDESVLYFNYPPMMRKGPPKATDKVPDENTFMTYIPNKEKVFIVAMIAKILSNEEGNEIGYPERPLLFSPQDQAIIKRWQDDLEKLKKKKYPKPPYPYPYLNINLIKNSIRV